MKEDDNLNIDKDNYSDKGSHLNSNPKIIIISVFTLLLIFLLIVVFTAGSNNDQLETSTGIEIKERDDAYNSDDDFVKNYAGKQDNKKEEEEVLEDFREVLVEAEDTLPISSRSVEEEISEDDFSEMVPISILDESMIIFDDDNTYSSVHLTSNEVITMRQTRFTDLSSAMKSTMNVYVNELVSSSENEINSGLNNDSNSSKQTQNIKTVARVGTTPTSSQQNDKWKLNNVIEKGIQNTLNAGSIIPATLITAINSTIQGTITAQVRNNVYDTAVGDALLIPQGTRIVGTYGSGVPYGENRLYVAWNRLVFPNGSTLDIGDMPGVDMTGKAGFSDKVNNHYLRTFGSALLLSLIVAGVNVSQSDLVNNLVPGYMEDASSAMSEALGQSLGETMSQMIRKNLNIAPEIDIRTGFLFNIMVVKDIVLPTYINSSGY